MPVAMDTQQQNFWVESINKEAAVRFAWQLRYSKNFSKTATEPDDTNKKEDKDSPVMKASSGFRSNLSAKIRQLEEEGKKLSEDKRSSTSSLVSRHSSKRSSKSSRSTSRKPSPLTAPSKGSPVLPLSDMRPPSVNTKSLLYNGISAHGEGRYAYLKKRSHMIPEIKYEFPVLSSNLHGWKILEYTGNEPQHSPYGRTCIIRDTFYRNSGITLN